MAKKPAAEVFDRYIDYAANLLRFDASTRLKVFKLLRTVEEEIIAKLREIDPTGVTSASAKQARLDKLLVQIRAMLNQKYGQINKAVFSDLKDLARIEGTFTAKTANSLIGVEMLSTAMNPQLIQKLVSKTLIVGAPSAEWWSRQSFSLQRRFSDQIRQGMIQGETLDELSQRIRGTATGQREGYKTASGEQRFTTTYAGGIMDIQRREADALIRSSVQAVSQAARLATYQENFDVIKGVRPLVVLDDRTSEICMAISENEDGWTLEGEPLGDSGPWPGPPPYHFNCRTTLVPIMKTWEELASPEKKAIAKQVDDEELSLRDVQASMDGPVPGDLKYSDWLETKSPAFQEELLGSTKYNLWKSGKITFRDLVDQSGNPLSAKELEDKFG